jgi:hypothetical protein
MVRALNSLISGASDESVQNALELHAVPRVKLILLSSTGSDGTHIFYESISDMGDSSKASQAEVLVEAVFEETIVAAGLKRVACALAASWLINSSVGIIENQQKIAYSLEKMALADLDRICKSPVLASAVSSVKEKSGELGVPVSLMIALSPLDNQDDIDDALLVNSSNRRLPAYSGAVLPYTGADFAGRISMNINGITIRANIEEGDSPATALRRLIAAYETSSTKANVNLGITEVPSGNAYRYITYENIDGNQINERFSFVSSGAKLVLLRKEYDKVTDVVAVTVYLESENPDDPGVFIPGVKGFIYGLSDNIAELTKEGPHTIAVDLKTGLGTKVSELGANSKTISSDTFLFRVGNSLGETLDDDTLEYQVNGHLKRIVNIPAEASANTIAELLAKDMAEQLNLQKVLAAVRPITRLIPEAMGISLASESFNAVCVEMVGIPIEVNHSKYVVTVLKVPEDVVFAVSPISSAAIAVFDEKSKSAIVTATVGNVSRSTTSSGDSLGSVSSVLLVEHKPSPGLKKLLDAFKNTKGF